jgi:hypothetical protein
VFCQPSVLFLLIPLHLVIVEAWRPLILIGVVLVGTLIIDVVFIIHLLRALFGMLACLMTVPGIFPFGLGKFINLASDETSKELFGKCVRSGVAWGRISILP